MLLRALLAESYGAWGKEAIDSFKMLASHLAIISGKTKSAVPSELYSRLNAFGESECDSDPLQLVALILKFN